MGLLYSLLIGGVAGWLAGRIMKGGGFGVIINIVLGIIGGLVGRWLFGVLGISINLGSAVLSDLLVGLIGAIVILFVAGLFKK